MGTRANSIATLIKDGINIDKDRVNVLLAEEFPTIVAGTDSATLSDAFDIDQLSVFLNGVKLKKTTEYTLADSALVLASGETFATDDVLSVLINSAAPAYTDKFTTLTDVSVAGQDSNTLVKFNGSNYTPTTLVEDGSGNVGIGTSAPAVPLDVIGGTRTGTDATHYGQITGLSAALYIGHRNDTDNGSILFGGYGGGSFDELMRITSGGNVGIGTSGPGAKLEVYGGSLDSTSGDKVEAFKVITNTTNGDTLNFTKIREAAGSDWTTAGWRIQQKIDAVDMAYLQFNGNGNLQGLSFGKDNTEYMRIKSDGEVLIAGTSDRGTYNLQVNGTGVWGQGAYTNGSDERMKEEIADLNDGLEVVNQLRPVTYRYREEFSEDRNTQAGFIAQELKQALSGKNYVEGTVPEGPEYLNVAYQNLIPVLTKAIQEQQTQIEAQQATIEALEARLTALEGA